VIHNFGFKGLRLRVRRSGFTVYGILGLMIQDSGVKVQGGRFRVQGLGFR
jgi:hypothetical protein